MSLHAQLSPEALARLNAQQRNSTITSIIISILVVLLIGIVLLWILLPPIDNYTPEIVSYQAGIEEDQQEDKQQLNRSVDRKPAAPTNNVAQAIAASTTSNIAIPIPVDVSDPSVEFASDEDWSEDSGMGFAGIPATMRERCSKEDRLARLAKNGGNKQCEEAVTKSLLWLKKTQNADGSWCKSQQAAMTGLAVLTYLGRCETPNSAEFGDSVTRGIIYLVNISMKNKGKITLDLKDKGWPYEHGIATYALGEAATFCNKLGINIPNLNEATKMAGDYILAHQHNSGSWVYHFAKSGGHTDNSVGLWQIQALKACKHTGLWDDSDFNRVIAKALAHIRGTQNRNGGIGYKSNSLDGRPPAVGWTMTGGGALAFQMWGKSHDSVVRNAAKYIKKNAKFDWNSPHADLYRHYYHAQAMINRGGEDWKLYNNLFRDQVLKNQNADGSWKDVGGGKRIHAAAPKFKEGEADSGGYSTHYRTCLATMMLEVYYRFLPATGAKGK